MPTFKYKAATANGEVQEGVMFADTKVSVISQLKSQGLLPIKADAVIAKTGTGKKPSQYFAFLRKRKVRPEDVEFFTEELYTLLKAGLPLESALEMLGKVGSNDGLNQVINQLRSSVREGAEFSNALAEYPELFSEFYVNMIRAGEAGGAMELVLERLVSFAQRRRETKDTLIASLIYPIILLFASVLSLAIVLGVVIPKISELFRDAGQILPWYTHVVIFLGDLVRDYGWVFGVLLLILFLGFNKYQKIPAGRRKIHRFVLNAPFIGNLYTKSQLVHFTRTLGVLLSNGVALIKSLEIARATVSNVVMVDSLSTVIKHVREGKGLNQSLDESGHFPDLAIRLIKVGEESGKLEEMLSKVADIYDKEVTTVVKRTVALLGPLMILTLAAIIAGIMISVIVPIFDINELAR